MINVDLHKASKLHMKHAGQFADDPWCIVETLMCPDWSPMRTFHSYMRLSAWEEFYEGWRGDTRPTLFMQVITGHGG